MSIRWTLLAVPGDRANDTTDKARHFETLDNIDNIHVAFHNIVKTAAIAGKMYLRSTPQQSLEGMMRHVDLFTFGCLQ